MSGDEKKSYGELLLESANKIADLERQLLILAMADDEGLESMVQASRELHSVDLSDVREGEESARVGILQAMLNLADAKDDSGRRLDKDNDFEKLTRQAIENFQLAMKRPVTGEMDEKTALELNDQRIELLEDSIKTLSSFEGTRV